MGNHVSVVFPALLVEIPYKGLLQSLRWFQLFREEESEALAEYKARHFKVS
jgi:hypothetical protein